MTTLHVHSNSSDQAPAADVKDRLAEILETAQQLQTDAEWLEIDASGLLTELEKIVGGAPASGGLRPRLGRTPLKNSTAAMACKGQNRDRAPRKTCCAR
jgi:hypothetical protein